MVKRTKHNFIFCLAAVISLLAASKPIRADSFKENKTLHFDQPLSHTQNFHFDLDDPLIPKPNDFNTLSVFFMSNKLGERWALITIENTSNSQRLLKNDNIVVTFADGKQRYAKNLDETLKGNEIISKAVFFGLYQFPIVKLDIGKQ